MADQDDCRQGCKEEGAEMTELAFPQPINPGEQGRGMTLRDYFAAKAMQGAISGCATRGEVVIYSNLAGLSYDMADAMMKARQA
jgi:hypothetical protein